ncbi:hypothetical protein LIP81_21445, partial [Erysipelatoclostridium ramosum]|nr:hypothetical protein [Thomasclavelia ramosa]
CCLISFLLLVCGVLPGTCGRLNRRALGADKPGLHQIGTHAGKVVHEPFLLVRGESSEQRRLQLVRGAHDLHNKVG